MNKMRQFILAFSLSLFLAACSSGGDSPTPSGGSTTTTPTNTTAASTTSVSGTVSKGPVMNATVDIYTFNTNGTQGSFVVGGITTDAYGAWNANIPSTATGPFMVIARGGSFVDEYTGATVPLGVVPLRGIMPTGATSAPITPISDAAVTSIQQMVTDGYANNPATAFSTIQTNYVNSLGFDPLTVLPPAPEHLATASADELKYAAILGGISTLANDAYSQLSAGGNTPDRMEIIAQMADDFAADGSIDGYGAAGAALNVNVGGAAQALNGVFTGGTNLGSAVGTYQALTTAPAQVTGTTVTITPVDFTQTIYVDTTAPTINVPANITLTVASGVTSVSVSDPAITAFLNSASATDNIDSSVTVSNNAPASFGLGVTTVIFNATDSAGNTSSATATVTINVQGATPDTTAPVVTAPANVSVSANQAAAIAAFLNGATASDNIDGTVAVTHNATLPLSVGVHLITFSATDVANNTGTATATITITAAAPTTGLTPTIPAIPTGVSFPAPTNPMAGINQLYLDATSGIGALFAQPAPAGIISYANFNSGVLNVVDSYANYNKTVKTSPGADGQIFTGDDKISSYSITNSNGTVGGTLSFDNPGADFTWFTTDDTASEFSTNYAPLRAGASALQLYRAVLSGADGMMFTSDDTLKSGYGPAYTIQTLDAAGNAVQVITISDAGTDGLWFTADDSIQSILQASFDAAGNQTISQIYNNKGADGLWFTADDLLQSYTASTFDGSGAVLTTLTASAGTDTYTFTADDVIIGFSNTVRDNYGRVSITASYSFIGADGTWLTADDTVLGNTYEYIGSNTYASTTVNITDPGADGAWGTGDDNINYYTTQLAAPLSGNITYNESGADGIWFTPDDLVRVGWVSFSNTYDLNGSTYTVTYSGTTATGADRVIPSADDNPSRYTARNLVSPYQAATVYNAGADGIFFTADDVGSYYDAPVSLPPLTRTTSKGIGADAIWFNADDPIVNYYTYELDANGNAIQYIYYDTYGTDATWYTTDDTVSSYTTNTFDASGNYLVSTNYTSAGADGMWFTADDVFTYKNATTYDASNRPLTVLNESASSAYLSAYSYDTAGNRTSILFFDNPGPDGIWNTADDHLSSATYYIIPVTGYPASIAGNTGIAVAGCGTSATSGDITVHVKLDGSSTPISGATIQLDKAGVTQSTLTTDAYGAATFVAVAGTADIHIFKDTYSAESFYCVQPNGAMDMYASLAKPSAYTPNSYLRFQATATVGLDTGRHINLFILDPNTSEVLAQSFYNQYAPTYLDMTILAQAAGSTITGDLWAVEEDSGWNTWNVYHDAVLVAANQSYTTVASASSATPINVSVAFNATDPAPILEATVGITSFPAEFQQMAQNIQARWVDGHDMSMVNGQAYISGNILPGQQLESIEAIGYIYSPINASLTYNAPIPVTRPATMNMISEFVTMPAMVSQDGLMAANPTITWTPPRQETANGIIAVAINLETTSYSQQWRLHAPVGMGQVTLPTVPAGITTLVNGVNYKMEMDTIARHGEAYQIYVSNVNRLVNSRFEGLTNSRFEAVKRGVTQETHTVRNIYFTR